MFQYLLYRLIIFMAVFAITTQIKPAAKEFQPLFQKQDDFTADIYQSLASPGDRFIVLKKNRVYQLNAAGSLQQLMEIPDAMQVLPFDNNQKAYSIFNEDLYLLDFQKRNMTALATGLKLPLLADHCQSRGNGREILLADADGKQFYLLKVDKNFSPVRILNEVMKIEQISWHPSQDLLFYMTTDAILHLYDYRHKHTLFRKQFKFRPDIIGFSNEGNFFFFENKEMLHIYDIRYHLNKPPVASFHRARPSQVIMSEAKNLISIYSKSVELLSIFNFSDSRLIFEQQITKLTNLTFSHDFSKFMTIGGIEGDVLNLNIFALNHELNLNSKYPEYVMQDFSWFDYIVYPVGSILLSLFCYLLLAFYRQSDFGRICFYLGNSLMAGFLFSVILTLASLMLDSMQPGYGYNPIILRQKLIFFVPLIVSIFFLSQLLIRAITLKSGNRFLSEKKSN